MTSTSNPETASDVDDTSAPIGEIYEAVGDVERWQRLTERLATMPATPEIEYHLQIARRAHERQVGLIEEVTALSTLHDQLALGAIVVDQDAHVLRANAVATRLLADAAGLALVDHRVQAADRDEHAILLTAIVDATTDRSVGKTPFILITRPGRPPLCVFVLPADEAVLRFFDDRQPVVLLTIDPDLSTVPRTHTLQALFGFTAREAECAALLMQGRSIDEAARSLGVTRSTARTFLAHMTAKTDSHSQTELLGRLLSIPHVT